MSQDSESQNSQGSLAPPVELAMPAISAQRTSLSASPELSAKAGSHTSQSEKNKLLSPPPLSSSDMTPPPSTVPGAPVRRSRSRSQSNSLLASPPDLEKTLCAAYGASENLPTAEEIDTASESRLRSIAKDLLGVAQESRMSALHFKLQNSLLSFSSNEAIKRAEVEHQLARREVEILQSSEYRNHNGSAEIKPLQPISNAELELAVKRNQELERSNDTLDRRLRRAKRLIDQEKVKSDLLNEEVQRLKTRIRDNRQHFSLMIENGSMSLSPHTGSGRHFSDNSGNHHGSHPIAHEENDAFAALLAAGRVLNNRDSASVASTPDQHHVGSLHSNGDMYGAHAMTSYPRTPARSQPAHQKRQYMTPLGNGREEQHDRDSTISASDAEEAETEAEEEVPDSQASSLATDMLRRNPASRRQSTRSTANAPKSSTLLQTKLFGQVRKGGVDRPSLKRKASVEEKSEVLKKSKTPKHVGLGIDTWGHNTSRA